MFTDTDTTTRSGKARSFKMICSIVAVDKVGYMSSYLLSTESELPAIDANNMYKNWKKAKDCYQHHKKAEIIRADSPRYMNTGNIPSYCGSAVPLSLYNEEALSGYYRGLPTRFLQHKFASLSNITAISEVQDSEGETTEEEMSKQLCEVNVLKNNRSSNLSDSMDTNRVMSTNEGIHRQGKFEGARRQYEQFPEANVLSRAVRTEKNTLGHHAIYLGGLNRLHSSSTETEQSQQLSSPQRLRRASLECLLSRNSEISNHARTRSDGPLLRRQSRGSDTTLDEISENLIIGRNKNNDHSKDSLSRERRKSWQCFDISWNNMVARAKSYQTPLEPNESTETSSDSQQEQFEGETEGNEISDTSSIVSSLSYSSHNSLDSSQDEISPLKSRAIAASVPATTCNLSITLESENSSLKMSPDHNESDIVLRQGTTFYTSSQAKPPSRRYSVASSSPKTSCQKVSGYSTHGALEYAKELLEKIQDEGKSKSKKERLDELSKALKWILEELNRIEMPDRELVTLMTSLRVQIFNLRAELKMEENDANEKKLQFPRHLSQDPSTLAPSRRFSWC